MTPVALLDAIADEGRVLGDMAAQQGTRVSIDPRALLRRDIALQPPGLRSPNGHCRLVKASDGWIAINLARPDDLTSVAAWLECDERANPWDAVMACAGQRPTADLLERAILLGLPVSVVGETALLPAAQLRPSSPARARRTVVDLSALWAGPLCGALLAQSGMVVTKIEDPARPDPTAISTPDHARRLNGLKRLQAVPLSSQAVMDAIAGADILITSARAHALARLGVTPDAVFARNSGLIWVAITAHGFYGDNAMRVGFGDDCAAAGGLVGWNDRTPHFIGDALADPLSGIRAARLALQAVSGSQSGLIDVALAPTAADFCARIGMS